MKDTMNSFASSRKFHIAIIAILIALIVALVIVVYLKKTESGPFEKNGLVKLDEIGCQGEDLVVSSAAGVASIDEDGNYEPQAFSKTGPQLVLVSTSDQKTLCAMATSFPENNGQVVFDAESTARAGAYAGREETDIPENKKFDEFLEYIKENLPKSNVTELAKEEKYLQFISDIVQEEQEYYKSIRPSADKANQVAKDFIAEAICSKDVCSNLENSGEDATLRSFLSPDLQATYDNDPNGFVSQVFGTQDYPNVSVIVDEATLTDDVGNVLVTGTYSGGQKIVWNLGLYAVKDEWRILSITKSYATN